MNVKDLHAWISRESKAQDLYKKGNCFFFYFFKYTACCSECVEPIELEGRSCLIIRFVIE